mmetsp:Transcript_15306/g.29552  ORF Transcript_15306/g.29552 Transcript_15306/m.29552 type:complete len:212 (-) Transcript_15306:84-719(-)
MAPLAEVVSSVSAMLPAAASPSIEAPVAETWLPSSSCPEKPAVTASPSPSLTAALSDWVSWVLALARDLPLPETNELVNENWPFGPLPALEEPRETEDHCCWRLLDLQCTELTTRAATSARRQTLNDMFMVVVTSSCCFLLFCSRVVVLLARKKGMCRRLVRNYAPQPPTFTIKAGAGGGLEKDESPSSSFHPLFFTFPPLFSMRIFLPSP